MARRQNVIATSITHSIRHSDEKRKPVTARIPAFFYVYWLTFECVREDLFKALRAAWQISEDEYRKSFGADDKVAAALKPMGDMGYSGSTFFTTTDSRYLVKSIPRHFEHSFFKNDLLVPYAEYMQNNPSSLLCRITDFLECYESSIGTMFGSAPSHHIVMDNILFGKGEDGAEWEDWDLKPMSYFYPERDVAGGVLSSEATKSKLADEFNDKILLSLDQAEEFKAQLAKDTALLAKSNAVDYSLFLVRIPYSDPADPTKSVGTENVTPAKAPFVPPNPPSWRTGARSVDGKYLYRAAILDFFWAKHKVHAKAMTGLINVYNAVDRQGPMSVTTESPEYRSRFMKMCTDLIETL
ncbi:SAICAR synthase [Lecanosticta acicola]|uniref:SAICAR synthase n=1 Tax=Lecanosticta acicola TaxID=111012 RepID=A0AAI8YUR5_9PEZI|nr:SAICAR synthase [Lecanosticta acicola]